MRYGAPRKRRTLLDSRPLQTIQALQLRAEGRRQRRFRTYANGDWSLACHSTMRNRWLREASQICDASRSRVSSYADLFLKEQ